ncbi:class I SAM-dependent methyltransferase [Actinomycetospora cinnamomea]|uniref:Ubiquinone/menaquinone biosynthesis C-methylase UbiE n=1 Tax=Actinomycetospora cinnamomea TaxID=663609 RepID=A0A2U1FFB6_9PSEU|nr:class I SAM-dependent methyltransferase [Actinomycetospora cinnamomea]PVZ10826.1 ubiquinone/menaquinone biosynthesis C-methylase UbiE [Actinomycetospora cinnamomea]
MNALRPYILDDAATVEYQRLDLMSRILDPWTRGYIDALGDRRGWHCLELGGGNGSVSEWLCETVGPTGSVTTIDVNTTLLDLVPAQNLAVQQADLRTSDLPSRAYDLVTCRALLHQIAEHAPTVLRRMAGAVRPGGWLVVQEPDFHLAPTTEPAVWAAAWRGLLEWGRDSGVDWFIGRRLPRMVQTAGFARPQAKTDVQDIRGGGRGALYFKLFFAEVRDRVLDSGRLDAATLDAAAALLDDPDYWTQCWMMTAVWARKDPTV